MDIAIQKALQEVFILATGRAASSSELAMLETYRGNGDWQPLVNLVNQHMNGVAEAQGGGWQGVSKTVQLVAKNAFGLNLSLQEAQSAVGLHKLFATRAHITCDMIELRATRRVS